VFEPNFTKEKELHYRRKIKLYYQPLAALAGLSLDPVSTSRWAELIFLGRAIDDYIDMSQLASLHDREAEVLAWLPAPQNLASASLPNLIQLGEEHLSSLSRDTSVILELNREFKSAKTVSDFIAPRSKEGALYARMILGCATPEVYQQPNYQKFSRILVTGGVALNLANSARGLQGDHLAGQTALEPTIYNSMALMAAAIKVLTSSTFTDKLHSTV
jgi:hypothetical protein